MALEKFTLATLAAMDGVHASALGATHTDCGLEFAPDVRRSARHSYVTCPSCQYIYKAGYEAATDKPTDPYRHRTRLPCGLTEQELAHGYGLTWSERGSILALGALCALTISRLLGVWGVA